MHHALQRVDTSHPQHLLGVEDPFPPFSKRLHDQEIPLPPPRNELVLSTEFHPGSLEDLSGGQPFTIIAVNAAEPKKDHQGLLLLREFLPHDESMVLATLGLPEGDFLVLGPLDPLLLVEVPMVNLSLQEF